MKYVLALVLALTLSASVSGASECSDKPECWPEGSTMRLALEQKQAADKKQERLYAEAHEIVILLPEFMKAGSYDLKKMSNDVPAHVDLHIKYAKSECDIASFAMQGGSGPGTGKSYQICLDNQLSAYLKNVQHAKECLLRGRTSQEKHYPAIRCLYQLAPSTIGP